jgi:hypothetical protein
LTRVSVAGPDAQSSGSANFQVIDFFYSRYINLL